MKIVFLLSALTFLVSCTPQVTPPPPSEKMMKEESMKKEDTMMKDDMMKTMSGDEIMKKESMNDTPVSGDTMMKPTGYMSYDEGKVKEALASGQKIALFFHASWCPSCRALDKAINTELSTIPSDTLIVKVDYDTSTEMRQKYGVTSQHTTVLIDRDMALISKKLGAKSVSEVLN